MSMTDPIADYLTQIRNALKAKKSYVDVPASNMKKSLTKILYNEHYVRDYIIIDDDLIYSHHPNESIQADDYLGLVSQKNIEIAPPSVTGLGDLQICAAIYAKREFRITHLFGYGKATLYIYGSLSAGSITATEPRYATRIVFDKRLETSRPPNFPMTNHYDLVERDR